MKTLYNKLHIFGQTMLLVFNFTLSVLSLGSCSKENVDYNHPDVDSVCQAVGWQTFSTQSPDGLSEHAQVHFRKYIEELLKHAEDSLTVIPLFSPGSGILFGRWQAPCYDEPLCGSGYMWW